MLILIHFSPTNRKIYEKIKKYGQKKKDKLRELMIKEGSELISRS